MSTTERDRLLAAIERVTLQARAVGVELDEPQVRKLLTHVELLQRWNKTYNLTAIRDPDAMWSQHILDCLAAVPSVRRELAARQAARARVLDVGSGGALPGAVWAVAMPEVDITCLDTVGKKVAFIRQVAGQPFDLIACRAFASLQDFTHWTAHLLAPDGCWVAMKGRHPQDELTGFESAGIRVFHVEHLTVPGLGAARCLVWMRPALAPT